ncbi:MAG: RNase H family protein [Breznakiellaceae bacterium]
MDRLNSLLVISWRWVKGHAGNPYNERVDRLTQEAIKSLGDAV